MTFHQGNVGRRKFRRCVGGAQGAHLAFLRGNQQAAATAVVGQPNAANHAQDVISIAAGVFQTSQGQQSRALGRNQPISLGMERPAAPGRAECAQGGEALVDEKIVGAIHGPGQHQIGAAVVQEITGQLDGVDRGGARGIQRKRDATQAQSLNEKVCRQARHEAVARVDRRQPQVVECFVAAEDLLHPKPFRVARQRRRGIGKVADHRTGAGFVTTKVNLAQCLAPGVEQPMEERIEWGDLIRRNREALRIENLFKTLHVSAAIVQRPIACVLAIACQDQSRIDAPTAGRRRTDHNARLLHQVPEIFGRQRPWQNTALPHDGNGRKTHERAGEPFPARRRAAGASGGPAGCSSRGSECTSMPRSSARTLPLPAKNMASDSARSCEASRPASTQRMVPAAGPG